MAKVKIGKSKRDNKNRSKATKNGTTKSKKPQKKAQKKTQKVVKKQKKVEPQRNALDSEGSEQGEDMLAMIDPEDLSFLNDAVTNNSYSMLKRINIRSDKPAKKRRKLMEESSDLEEQYENQTEEPVKMKNLLPIKTKRGLIPRSMVDDKKEETDEEMSESENNDAPTNGESDAGIETTSDFPKPMPEADMLVRRQEILEARKVQIGSLSASLLEAPEERILNFKKLLEIMMERTPEVYITVRKLATVSLLEVFKDLLPSYQIMQQESKGQLKKETKLLQRYESQLLNYYKNYLKNLEKYSSILIRKKGDNTKRSQEELNLAKLAVQCMCELLETHPYFNFSQNIAQATVPFMNHPVPAVRQMVNASCKVVFKDDKKGEITLKILRIINQYMKNHAHNVNTEMLEVLLGLKIKEVNLDQEKEHEIKQKKMMAQKQKLLQMSRKERKRKKKLEHLQQEMMETKAEENKQNKQKYLTEITKIVFGVYFRILKSSTNTKVLGVCLEGLAKYSHCINLEFYSDLVKVLINLLSEDWLGYREQLHCIQTVLVILSGQGEALNLDPSYFYVNLYENLLTTHAGNNYKNFPTVLHTLTLALVKRRKKVTRQRLIGYTKRICTLGLQLLHNGTLGCLAIVKNILQLNKSVDVLLDLDSTVGDGRFLPELADPEYCNASSSALYELAALSKHYHPTVCKFAKHVASGVPASGEGSLPPELGKCAAEQLCADFDPAGVRFNPAVPAPRRSEPKHRPRHVRYRDPDFKAYCYRQAKRVEVDKNKLNFVI